MTLLKLQDILGDRILISLREDLTPENRQQENEQTRLVMNTAKQMINNGKLILETEKILAQNRNLKKSYAYMLIDGKDVPDERIAS